MVLAGNITFQSSSLNQNWSELATSTDANSLRTVSNTTQKNVTCGAIL